MSTQAPQTPTLEALDKRTRELASAVQPLLGLLGRVSILEEEPGPDTIALQASGGSGGEGVTMAEVLEVLAGDKDAKAIKRGALSPEILALFVTLAEVKEVLAGEKDPGSIKWAALDGAEIENELGAVPLSELLEILAGTKHPGSIDYAALSAEVQARFGSGGVTLAELKEILAGEKDAASIKNAALGSEVVKTSNIALLAITAALIANGTITKAKLTTALQEELGITVGEYGAVTARTSGEEWEPSATKPTMVQLVAVTTGGLELKIEVNGKPLPTQWAPKPKEGNAAVSVGFPVPPGGKVKQETLSGSLTEMHSTTTPI